MVRHVHCSNSMKCRGQQHLIWRRRQSKHCPQVPQEPKQQRHALHLYGPPTWLRVCTLQRTRWIASFTSTR